MGKISLLDEKTINRIAAGEVVERPASVVKELVENSLDAGATSVLVEIESGGAALIRVSDDGSGMDREDALLAFERHATSKIRAIDDVPRSGTLGFRGEALPSIAAVSRVEAVTQTGDNAAGTRVQIEGGKVLACVDVGARGGTTVTVRDLFFNTPARLKFLKSQATETARTVEAVLRAALSAPRVRLLMRVDGREVLASPGTGDPFDVIVSAYGTEFARSLLRTEGAAQGASIEGYVSRPGAGRSSRAQQHFFVNGRAVRDNGVRWALEEAYGGSIPRGRFPAAFLYMRVEPQDVDVNVHPAKAEVRFKDDRLVKRLVLVAVSRGIGRAAETMPPSESREVSGHWGGGPSPEDAGGLPPQCVPRGEAAARSAGGHHDLRPYSGGLRYDAGARPDVFEALRDKASTSGRPDISQMTPVGQALGTYVIAEYRDGIALLDQHAAHERVNFERIAANLRRGQKMAQPLLVPKTVELGPAERAVLREYWDSLSALGYDIEEFGGKAVLVRSAVSAGGADIPLEAVLERLVTDQPVAVEEWLGQRAAAAVAACVASVKAGQWLDAAALRSLIDALAVTSDPLYCPHGRPTVVFVDKSELERRFGRK